MRFRPGAGRATVGRGLAELRDGVAPIDRLGSIELDAVADALLAATGLRARAEIVTRQLGSRAAGHPLPPPVVAEALRRFSNQPGPIRIAAIAGDLGVTERRLQRSFRHHVGVSPKLAARLIRVERLVGPLERCPDQELAALAVGAGFYDQAHMTNETGQVLGCTPATLAAEVAQRKRGTAFR